VAEPWSSATVPMILMHSAQLSGASEGSWSAHQDVPKRAGERVHGRCPNAAKVPGARWSTSRRRLAGREVELDHAARSRADQSKPAYSAGHLSWLHSALRR